MQVGVASAAMTLSTSLGAVVTKPLNEAVTYSGTSACSTVVLNHTGDSRSSSRLLTRTTLSGPKKSHRSNDLSSYCEVSDPTPQPCHKVCPRGTMNPLEALITITSPSVAWRTEIRVETEMEMSYLRTTSLSKSSQRCLSLFTSASI